MKRRIASAEIRPDKKPLQALSPEGNEIIGTLDVVQGTARADLAADGTLAIEYLGETEGNWNSQRSKTQEGERLFVCSQRKIWPENQIILARAINIRVGEGSRELKAT